MVTVPTVSRRIPISMGCMEDSRGLLSVLKSNDVAINWVMLRFPVSIIVELKRF
jgi:hypothetical protein